jgi:hypothetical protein
MEARMPDLIDLREEIGGRMRAGMPLDDVEWELIEPQNYLSADDPVQ